MKILYLIPIIFLAACAKPSEERKQLEATMQSWMDEHVEVCYGGITFITHPRSPGLTVLPDPKGKPRACYTGKGVQNLGSVDLPPIPDHDDLTTDKEEVKETESLRNHVFYGNKTKEETPTEDQRYR